MVENARRNHSLQGLGKEQSLSVLQVILAAMADGRKLEPYVVFKGVHPVAALMATQGVMIAFSRNGWMNEAITNDWVTRVWGALNFQRRLLVWDAYRCHLMSSVSSHVEKSNNSEISVIPGGLTSHLQPADVSCNKPFKEAYKVFYDEWMGQDKSPTPRQATCVLQTRPFACNG